MLSKKGGGGREKKKEKKKKDNHQTHQSHYSTHSDVMFLERLWCAHTTHIHIHLDLWRR